MSEPMEDLISKFVQGTLDARERAAFDAKFESDPAFSAKALEALGQRLGPAPEAFLERMGKAAQPVVEGAWRDRVAASAAKKGGPGFSVPWSALGPVAFLVVGLAGLGFGAKMMLSRGVVLSEDASEIRYVEASSWEEVSPSGTDPERAVAQAPQPTSASRVETLTRKVREGHVVRFENLPVSDHTLIDVVDSKGVLVKRLYEGPWIKGQRLDWDGRGDDGQTVSPGAYQAKVRCPQGTFVSRFTVQ